MSYVLESGNENSKVIHITSSDAQKLGEGFLQYNLESAIIAPPNQDTLVSLYSAIVPYSFYNIREGVDDKIWYSAVGSSTQASVTIPEGSYTINSLQSKLKTLLDTIINAATSSTITFDRITMKFTYNIPQHAGANQIYFNWSGKLDGAEIAMGFTKQGMTSVAGFTSLVSDNVPDVNGGVHSVNIRTNLTSKGSIDSQTKSFSTILGTMPIDVNFGGVIFFRPADAVHKILITGKEIKTIIVRITDDRDRLLDLNGLDFNVTILIDHIKHERTTERRRVLLPEKIEVKKRGRPPNNEKTKKDIKIPLIN